MFTKAEVILTFLAAAILEKRRFVKYKSGTTSEPPEVVYADAGEAAVGITEYKVGFGELVAVRPVDNGLMEVTANGTVAINADLYVADNGKVSTTSAGEIVGKAHQAAASADEIIAMKGAK